MAPRKKKTEPAPAAPEAPAINLALLGVIVRETRANGVGTWASALEIVPLVERGLVSRTGHTHPTDATLVSVAAIEPAASEALIEAPTPGHAPIVAPTVETARPMFQIETNVPVPVVAPRARVAESKYPFAQLPVNGSFFVPKTAETSEPWKSLSSTVAGATRKLWPAQFRVYPWVAETNAYATDPATATGARVFRLSDAEGPLPEPRKRQRKEKPAASAAAPTPPAPPAE